MREKSGNLIAKNVWPPCIGTKPVSFTKVNILFLEKFL